MFRKALRSSGSSNRSANRCIGVAAVRQKRRNAGSTVRSVAARSRTVRRAGAVRNGYSSISVNLLRSRQKERIRRASAGDTRSRCSSSRAGSFQKVTDLPSSSTTLLNRSKFLTVLPSSAPSSRQTWLASLPAAVPISHSMQ